MFKNKKMVVCIVSVVVLVLLIVGIYFLTNSSVSNSEVNINGVKYDFPLKTSDILKEGYKLDLESLGIEDSDKLLSDSSYGNSIKVLDDEKAIGVQIKIKNDSKKAVYIKDTSIYSLKVTENNDFSLTHGLKVGSKKDDFKDTLGNPVSSSKGGSSDILEYKISDKVTLKAEFVKGKAISLEYCLDD